MFKWLWNLFRGGDPNDRLKKYGDTMVCTIDRDDEEVASPVIDEHDIAELEDGAFVSISLPKQNDTPLFPYQPQAKMPDDPDEREKWLMERLKGISQAKPRKIRNRYYGTP